MSVLCHVTNFLFGESLKIFRHVSCKSRSTYKDQNHKSRLQSLIPDLTEIHCPGPQPLHAARQIDMTSQLHSVDVRMLETTQKISDSEK